MNTFLVVRRSASHPETIRVRMDVDVAMQSSLGKTFPAVIVEAETFEVAETMVHEQYGKEFSPVQVVLNGVPNYEPAPSFLPPQEWSPDNN
jgi:hypothetical protein